MQSVFNIINAICEKIQVISDFFWNFPANFKWYSKIPIFGNFSLAIILLIGSGIYFSLKLRFIQVRRFKYSISLLKKTNTTTGISPLASFFLSTAMRVGPGNIIGVTGAISTGGPGALFWMWISAFFGMATAFVESTLSQIFKEQKDDEYVGGLAYYGKKLLKGSSIVGIVLSFMYIIYAFLCLPAQGFNTIKAIGNIGGLIAFKNSDAISPNSSLYWIAFIALIIFVIIISFGGIKKVSKVTDIIVPIMAVVYVLTIIMLIIINIDQLPFFFKSVFRGAFKPSAVFGGAFGIALQQGVKRGLMSNEAGQGTITMPAAASDAKHPCDQGCVQAVGVFLDTMVIATLTGFVVIMGHVWLCGDKAATKWFAMDKLPRFLASISQMTPGTAFNNVVNLLICLCFGLFAFTCLLGFMSFSEICATRISKGRFFINTIRILNLCVISFGIITSIAGFNLDSLWNLSDFANILICLCNIPLLYIGFKYVKNAVKHFELNDNTPFNSKVAKINVKVWDDKEKETTEVVS